MSNYSVSLVGPAPWGFRLQGGKDFNMPLTISRLSDGGKASQAHIGIGDVVLTIDGISTDGMTHLEAQNKIKACTGSLSLTLQKASAVPKANPNPPQTEAPKEIFKPVPIASPTPVAPKVSNVAYNKAPKPFGSVTSSKPASIPSASSAFTPASAALSLQSSPQPSALSLLAKVGPPPHAASGLHANSKPTIEGHSPALSATKPAVNVPRQPASYSQTANLYDNEIAQDGADVRRGQKENQGDKQQNGPPRKHIVDTYTDIYHTSVYSDASKKRLMDNTEDWHPRTGTTQSRSFRILAQMTGTEHMNEPEPENVQKTKESNICNGDISTSVEFPKEREDQKLLQNTEACSVATQTDEASPVEEMTLILDPSVSRQEPAMLEREETSFVSSCRTSPEKPSVQTSPSQSPNRRKSVFDNPLESLPKAAPFPPATVQIFKVNSQVATITKTASVYMRSSMIIPDPLLENSSSAATVTNGIGTKINIKEKCSIATQTCDKVLTPASPTCAVEYTTSIIPSSSQAASRIYIPENTMKNPLDTLPKCAPCPPPVLAPLAIQNCKSKVNAVAAVTAFVGAQARLSDPFVSRSLLDALLISPIPKPPFPTSKPSRKSTGGLYTGQNHSNVTLEAPQATAASKTMPISYNSSPSSKPVTSKPTTWQPAPSNAQVTNNPSNAVKPSSNNKSVPPPWVEDKDTLVQRAEHIPAGTRTPMCATCNKAIRGPFLLALGKSWHPEEFNCAHCKSSMAEMGFVEEKGGLYCEICYEKFFAPDCARCQRKILGEVINALKQTWHVSCFVCVACHNPIRNSVFHLEDGEPYCETDYYSLFGTICHGCEFPIEAGDRFLEALGHTWHNTCFVCTICCENLEGQAFFSKKEKLLCKKHAHSVNF
ncbi:PDZ and LIM domain 5 L homeolog isoform X3 [Xenopus laevis]|uniref:PDZ and LIM domain 5 L homeolog isoform X3 n=1 Tax=Xenopus laevis TaxID=8355 RepID=A0A8J1M0Z7_XENLA|nr:PDZ and LIM domain 5 L homeolog isoform X3 [Xenopus laevis]